MWSLEDETIHRSGVFVFEVELVSKFSKVVNAIRGDKQRVLL